MLGAAAAAMILAAGAAPTATASRRAEVPLGSCAPRVSLLGWSDALDGHASGGLPLVGLSALRPTGPGMALALTDDIGTQPARLFRLRLGLAPGLRSTAPAAAGLRVAPAGVIRLRDVDGTPLNGADFDGESLVVLPGGRDVLVGSEHEPSIREVRLSDGRVVAELPVPTRFENSPLGQATPNGTFEGMASTDGGRTLWVSLEEPLSADGTDAAGHPLLRLLRYTRTAEGWTVTRQLALQADPTLGVSDIAGLSGDRLLVLERAYEPTTGNTVRLYIVSTRSPDVTGLASLSAAPPRVFAHRTLLADLVHCPTAGARNPGTQVNPLLDNVEGLYVGGPAGPGRRQVWLISDDNDSQTEVTRVYTLSAALG